MNLLTEDIKLNYETKLGKLFVGSIENALLSPIFHELVGKINLIFTSPPFPLIRKKAYGNKNGDEYISWLEDLAPKLAELLADEGSIVVEVGNAWVEGLPVMSTLPLEALLAFKKAAGLHLCQHIICHNPARLPGPAQWVNIERIRLKDSFTHVFWMSKSLRPKADNRRVLLPYSEDMKKLLRTKKYNTGERPSGHVISETGFLRDHGGAISASVLEQDSEGKIPHALLKYAGTSADWLYRKYCEARGVKRHPARMQMGLVAFFIEFLTNSSDLVFDPFAGSNTTGAVAEALGRQWIAVESNEDYAEGSKGRFELFREME